MKKIVYVIFSILIFITACDKEPVKTVYFDFENKEGVFITCEGNFMNGNSSLSFYDKNEKRVYNNIFAARNNVPLGDVAHSMTIKGDKAYIVINNSGKIYIVDKNTCEYQSTISGLSSPRYIKFISPQKAYISDLYAKAISIYNPETGNISSTIDVNNGNEDFYQHSTEQMITLENELFVNCWSYDNKILVINTDTDKLVDSITVPIQPNSMVLDKNNKLWVLTDGGFEGSAYGYEKPCLLRINPMNRLIEKKIMFQIEDHPSSLCLNATKDTMYYINRHVFRCPIDNGIPDDNAFIESTFDGVYGGFYSLSVDPESSEIYVADALDYQQHGIIYRYSPDGKEKDHFKVGVIPGSFCFK
jgi:sugar lactone lactonase YvrE